MKRILLSVFALFIVMATVNVASAVDCECGCQKKCNCECCQKGNCNCSKDCKCHNFKCTCKNCKCKCPICKKQHKFFLKKQIKCNCDK